MGERRIGLFWDFENFELRCRSASKKLDVDRVMAFVRPRGRIVVNRAYADWTKHSTHMQTLTRLGVETIQVTPVAREKNAADIKLVVDVMVQILPEPAFDELVIVTSDADFTPLISVSLQKGVDSVTAVGTKTSASRMWRESVSEFVEYLDLPASDRFGTSDADPPKGKVGGQARKIKDSTFGQAVANKVGQALVRPGPQESIPDDVRDLVLRAIAETPKKADGGFIQIGPLKTRVISLSSTFDFKDYGCRTFKAFLERLGDVIELSQQGMHTWVRLAGESSAGAVAAPAAAPVQVDMSDPYAVALSAPGGRPPAPGQFAPLLDVLASREPGVPVPAATLEAELEPVAAVGGLPAKGIKNFLTNAHVVYVTDDGVRQRTADRRVLAVCMVDGLLRTLVKRVPGRLDAERVAQAFGGEDAPPEIRELLTQLGRGAMAAVPPDDAALDRLSLGGVPGGPEHRARVVLADCKIPIDSDLMVEAINRLTDALDPLPDREGLLAYLNDMLLADWALEPDALGAMRGLLVRSGIVEFDDGGGRLAPDIRSTDDAWRRVGRLLAGTATSMSMQPCPHPYVLAGVALPARFEAERRAVVEGAAAELAPSDVVFDPSAKDFAEHEVHDRTLEGPAGLVAKALWANRLRIEPEHIDLVFASLSELASQSWSTKEAFKEHLASLFAAASLSSDGPAVNRVHTILVKVGAVEAGPPLRIRPIDATTAWDRLVPRIVNYIRGVCGFIPWPTDLLLVLGGGRPSEELSSAVLRWIGVAEAVWIPEDERAVCGVGLDDDQRLGTDLGDDPDLDRQLMP